MDLIVTAATIIVCVGLLIYFLDNTPLGQPLKQALAKFVAANYGKVKNTKLMKDLPPELKKRLEDPKEKRRHRGRRR